MTRYFAIDLFCGAGGFSEGLRQSGWNVILALDSWKEALHVHRQNHPNCRHVLTEIQQTNSGAEYIENEIVDAIKQHECTSKDRIHIHASPPCQDLSSINPHRQHRIDMTRWIYNFLIRFVHKYQYNITWTIEQVVHKDVIAFMKKEYVNVYDMSCYGICQSRKRLIVSNVQLHLIPSETKVGIKTLFTVPENAVYIGNTNISRKKWQEQNPNSRNIRFITDTTVSYTVVSTPAWFIDKDRELLRPLTLEENIRLQTFSAEYFKVDLSKTIIKRLVANSVPPLFARKIGDALLDHKKNTKRQNHHQILA
jgi:site-specific DNA-cytosine methylase